jgi:hypothetical protein
VLKSQATIGLCQLKVPQVEEELEQHNEEYTKAETSLRGQIEIVLAGREVMAEQEPRAEVPGHDRFLPVQGAPGRGGARAAQRRAHLADREVPRPHQVTQA